MKHLIFDTETTNLIKNSLQPLTKQPRVIEFFGLVLDDTKDWVEVESFQQYINPTIPISAEVVKITGIDDEMVKGMPRFHEVSSKIVSLLKRADIAVAHNLSYDYAVMNYEFARIERKPVWPSRRVCTVEATEHLKGFRLNLTALHTYLFDEPFKGAHGAEADTRATARCYVELKKRGEI